MWLLLFSCVGGIFDRESVLLVISAELGGCRNITPISRVPSIREALYCCGSMQSAYVP